MSFSPEVYRKKLQALQDTQESIVSISQWLLFHHRHSKELCDIWAQYILSEDPAIDLKKKLSLLYLCNDVVQQARHKRKPEFIEQFSKALPGVLHRVYPTINSSLQPKVDRLINVWDQRNIFEKNHISKMKKALESLRTGKELDVTSGEGMPSKTPPQAQIASELIHLNNTYNHLTSVLETASSNLSQVGVQCKLYLPQNPENQDNLPLPNVYIAKLNVLEKLCYMTQKNLEDAMGARKDIIGLLNNLSKSLSDALASDETKIKIIQQRLERLHSTKADLHEILGTSYEPSTLIHPEFNAPMEEADEEPSPAFETNLDEDDGAVPTYENSSSDDDDENHGNLIQNEHVVKRRRLSENSEPSKTPDFEPQGQFKASKKTVAFSEDIQVKEFVREEQSNIIQIVRSNGDLDEDRVDDGENGRDIDVTSEFSKHHKDDLELKHERYGDGDDDSYEPSMGGSTESGTNDTSKGGTNGQTNSGLLSLLSKLS